MPKFTFIADLHHYSATLGTRGRAYERRSGSDQKCLGETGAIIDSAFDMIGESDCDAVFIAGDITNNGERVSHEEIREKLRSLKAKKPVYVITATHDWCCDKNPRRFEGNNTYHDVPTMKAEELADFYRDFGLGDAIDSFTTHLGTVSYCVEVCGIRVLCLNDDQNGKGKAGFADEHLEWIKKQAENADRDGKPIIAMEHHLLMSHIHPMLSFGSMCVGDKEKIASAFADSGIKYVFVGHSHLQSIEKFTSPKGNSFYEINVGSLVGYPSPIVEVIFDGDRATIETKHPGKFTYEGREYDTVEYTKKHSLGLVDNIFEAALIGKEEFVSRLTAMGLPEDKVSMLYIIAKPMIKYVRGLTVGEGYKKLKLFGLAKLLDKNIIEEYKHKKVMDFAYEIFMSALDGGKSRHPKGSSYYKAVMDFMAIPVKLKDCSMTRNLRDCVGNIITGNEWDINHCIV